MIELLVALFVISMVFLLGALYGWNVHERFMDRKFNEVLGAVSKTINENVIHINIEKHDGMIYIYDKETKNFMAQGKTRDEVESVLAEKFPGKKFASSTEELKAGFGDA